jgi:hypothetical protein
MKTAFILFASMTLFCWCAPIGYSQDVMSSSLDPIPAGWTGKVFALSKNYPTSLPVGAKPWTLFDFRTQPLQYINAVKSYVLAGNTSKDWVLQNNTTRKWYHAPSMIWGENGREFINGMTRERNSQPKELHPLQLTRWQNWAVGFYNNKGGYTLGKVYANPNNPTATQAVFPDGTVAAKLLFTNASVAEVPYLTNSFTWQGNIHTTLSGTTRSPDTLRLLQMDIAVKDSRAGTTTDWVMITFAYNNSAPGATPWDRLVPVGLQWGNDLASINSGAALTETWINPQFVTLFTIGDWKMHTGYKNRLNGPVDNPSSSCLSCHGTAQMPAITGGMTPNTSNNASLNKYFRNINPPAVFEDLAGITETTLDYSLQLKVGIPLAIAHAPHLMAITSHNSDSTQSSDLQSLRKIKVFLTTRDIEEADSTTKTPHGIVADPAPSEDKSYSKWLWVLGGIIGLLLYFFIRRK